MKNAAFKIDMADWAANVLTEVLLRMNNALAAVFKRHKNLKIAALVIAIGFLVSGAFAQSSAPTLSSNAVINTSADSVIQFLGSTVADASNGLKNNKALKNLGQTIAVFLLLMLLTWEAFKAMASGGGLGEMISEWIPVLISFALVQVFLSEGFGQQLVEFIDGIGSSLSGAVMKDPASAIFSTMRPMFDAIYSLLNMQSVTGAKADASSPIAFISNFGENMAAALMFILTLGVKIAVAFLIVIAGVVMLAHILMAFFSKYLALAIGFVMIPFLMWRTMSWVFDSWLKFLIGACMLQLVASLLMTFVQVILQQLTASSAVLAQQASKLTIAEAMLMDYMQLSFLALFALLSTLIMAQAPAIANGLLSGGGSHGFGGLRGLLGGTGMRSGGAARAGANSAGGSVVSGIAGAGRAAAGQKFNASGKPFAGTKGDGSFARTQSAMNSLAQQKTGRTGLQKATYAASYGAVAGARAIKEKIRPSPKTAAAPEQTKQGS